MANEAGSNLAAIRESMMSCAAAGKGFCALGAACPNRTKRDEGVLADLLPLMMCSGCKLAAYCDKACQKAGWAEHKLRCKEKQPTAPSSDWLPSKANQNFHIAARDIISRASGPLAVLHALWTRRMEAQGLPPGIPPMLHLELASDEDFALPCAWRASAYFPGMPPRAADWLNKLEEVKLFISLVTGRVPNPPYDAELRSGERIGVIITTPSHARIKFMSLKHGVPLGQLRSRVRDFTNKAAGKLHGASVPAPVQQAAMHALNCTHLLVGVPGKRTPADYFLGPENFNCCVSFSGYAGTSGGGDAEEEEVTIEPLEVFLVTQEGQ